MNKLWAMYFSGTGGTEKVTKSIAETIGSKLNIHNIEGRYCYLRLAYHCR